MTQCEKILRYMLKHPEGMTMRDGYLMYINSPHKRVSELEQRGVKIKRVPITSPGGARIVCYKLAEPKQEQIAKLLKAYGATE